MPGPSHDQDARRRIAELCLELPGATGEPTGPNATYLVARRKFVYLLDGHHGDRRLGLCVGDGDGRPDADDRRYYRPAHIGPRGWIGLDLTVRPVDWTEVAGLIAGSYLHVASKRLAAQI